MLPPDFSVTMNSIRQAIGHVDGWLTPREVNFLATAAACPTARGRVLEIGSYRGRSTIVLALASRSAVHLRDIATQPIVAVDPLPNDGPMMPDGNGQQTARALFDHNLQQAGVRWAIEFHQQYSYEFAPAWNEPLRLLWIDGDHSYPSSKQDFDLFSPYLADGAILAMHDVLSRYDGCIRVFTEDVLTSRHFGAAGICGSIGWAQYWADPERARPHRDANERLLQQLLPLVPFHCRTQGLRGIDKWHYKFLRARVPHRRIHPQQWLRRIDLNHEMSI